MKTNTQNLKQNSLKIFALVLTLSLVACSQKSTQSLSASISDGTRTTSGTSNKPLAYCSHNQNSEMNANTMVFTQANQTIRTDLVWLNLSSIPAEFENGQYMQIFRWKADTTGAPFMDKTPLQFRFQSKKNSQVGTGYSNYARWAELSSFRQSFGENSAASFFNSSMILVDIKDLRAEYDAIRIVVYNSSGSVVQNLDILIPSFYANPADYAVEDNGVARSNLLQAIHPFVGQTNSDSYHFATLSQDLCNAFSN